MRFRKLRLHPTHAATLAVACVAVAAPSASAATTPAVCPEQLTTKAFAKIGDLADYSLAPRGDFESGTAGWQFMNAKVVSGNETVGILPGTRSVALGGWFVSGPSTVTTPPFCVDQSHPYFRYLVKANGPVGVLATYIRYQAANGSTIQSAVQSAVSPTVLPGKWKVSTLNPLSVNIPLLKNGGTAAVVQLVFATPMSVLGAGYNIDNVMIDPYRRG